MNTARIKEIIDKSGLSHVQLAKAAGLSRQAIDMLVTSNDCKVSTLEKVASVLGVDIAYMLGNEEVKVEIRGGRNVFLNSNNNQTESANSSGNSGQVEIMKKTIAAQEKTISTQQMLIDLLTKK